MVCGGDRFRSGPRHRDHQQHSETLRARGPMMSLPSERDLYPHWARWLLNAAVFPLKMVVPQPLIARVPIFTTNEDIRVGLVKLATRGRLLDVGCGLNRLAREYRAEGGDAVGVDVYPWQGV